jgi:ribonuclease-3
LKIDNLQHILSVTFKDPALLEQALIHDSYINENPGLTPVSNERLEFLGDAILGMIVARKLYHDFPDYSEGKMTNLRAALVRRDTLARMAEAIGLGEYLYLGKGEEASGGRKKVPNLAGAIEAVIGAIFLDRGIREATTCTWRLLQSEYDSLIKTGLATDYKSRLQELVQARQQQTPVYIVVDTSGPDHARWFTIEVRLGNDVLGQGSGKSKKTAESEAAHNALDKLPHGL